MYLKVKIREFLLHFKTSNGDQEKYVNYQHFKLLNITLLLKNYN